MEAVAPWSNSATRKGPSADKAGMTSSPRAVGPREWRRFSAMPANTAAPGTAVPPIRLGANLSVRNRVLGFFFVSPEDWCTRHCPDR